MNTDLKIAATISVIGFAGLVYNLIKVKDTSDVRNHLYSTAPAFGGLIFIVLELIWR